ncbi:MAG: hypothetical protein EXR72_05045 [Myxococcales bacterium]|nr:hypothetical protein [Myxococcales bacterium]
MEVLETNGFQAPAKSNLDAWINAYKVPVTTVKDAAGMPLATFNALGVRESLFLVDLKTMKIVDKINGSVLGMGDSAVKTAIPKMLKLLGK